MTNHSTTKRREEHKKSEPPKGKLEESSKVERDHLGGDEDMTARISFTIDFSLAEGAVLGKITHRLTNKHAEFSGLDQTTITQFMKQYLSRLEKSVIQKPVEEPSQHIQELLEEEQAESKETPASGMRSRSFGIIVAGTTHPRRVLEQGRPFHVRWSFETPSLLSMQGQQLNYRVTISRKSLAGGGRELVGEIGGKRDFSEPLTASFECESLPPGTYRFEGDASFWSLKSRKPEWRSSCSESWVMVVN